jgi:hypothetical protein
MGEELELRGLISSFYKMNKRAKKYCVYHQPLNNNLIVFSPYDDCDVNSVCDSIRDSMYFHLIEVLNTWKNVLVSWSQVSGTTSDYTIYYDMPVNELKSKSYKEIWEYINGLNIKYVGGYKYTEVRDGIEYKLAEKNYDDFESIYIVGEE